MNVGCLILSLVFLAWYAYAANDKRVPAWWVVFLLASSEAWLALGFVLGSAA